MTATSTRTWTAAALALALVLTTATWLLLIGPERADALALREQAADAEAVNVGLQARTEQLRAQLADLPAKRAELTAVREAMPQDAELPELLRTLDRYADDSAVTLMGVSPGAPVVATTATEPVATTPPVATGAVGEAAPVVDPSVPVTVEVPLSMTVIGGFFAVESFLERVQSDMDRALLVTGVSMTAEAPGEATGGRPATVSGDVTLTITGKVFVLRDAATPPVTAVPPSPLDVPPPVAPAVTSPSAEALD